MHGWLEVRNVDAAAAADDGDDDDGDDDDDDDDCQFVEHPNIHGKAMLMAHSGAVMFQFPGPNQDSGSNKSKQNGQAIIMSIYKAKLTLKNGRNM